VNRAPELQKRPMFDFTYVFQSRPVDDGEASLANHLGRRPVDKVALAAQIGRHLDITDILWRKRYSSLTYHRSIGAQNTQKILFSFRELSPVTLSMGQCRQIIKLFRRRLSSSSFDSQLQFFPERLSLQESFCGQRWPIGARPVYKGSYISGGPTWGRQRTRAWRPDGQAVAAAATEEILSVRRQRGKRNGDLSKRATSQNLREMGQSIMMDRLIFAQVAFVGCSLYSCSFILDQTT
jgi:hypothetical protein